MTGGAGGATVAFAMDHRINAEAGVDGPSVTILGTGVDADESKQLQSVTLPDDLRFEVLAVTLD